VREAGKGDEAKPEGGDEADTGNGRRGEARRDLGRVALFHDLLTAS